MDLGIDQGPDGRFACSNRRYCEGQHALFPKVAENFDDLVDYIERLVELYNRSIAQGLDSLAHLESKHDYRESDGQFFLDLLSLEKLAENPAEHQTAYLVDMAKVEALDTIGENRKAVELLDRHV